MSTKRLRLFLVLQAALLVVVAGTVALGDHSHPSVLDGPLTLQGMSPLVLTFDRPVDRTSVQNGFSMKGPDGIVAGSFSWSSHAVAFTPDESWRSESAYTLVLHDALARDGGRMPVPYTRTINTDPARFLYLNPQGALVLYSVSRQTQTTLSRDGERVLSFDVSNDGAFALMSYTSSTDGTHGLAELLFHANTSVPERVNLMEDASSHLTNIHVCDSGRTVLAVRNLDHPPTVGSPWQMVKVTLDAHATSAPQIDRLFTEATEPSAYVVACSASSDVFVYQGAKLLQLDTLSSRAPSPLGDFQDFYGFSPKSDLLLLNFQVDPSNQSNRIVYALDRSGSVKVLSDAAQDSTDAALDPTQRLLATASVALDHSGEVDPLVDYRIAIKGNGGATATITPPTGIAYRYPQWSPDGRTLAFDALLTDNLKPVFVENEEGHRLDGEILLVDVNAASLPDNVTPTQTRLIGGSVHWLP